ncbi:hypothetical protein C5Y96_10905 [Blastopirellula marina]|uniref:DUF6795 domain-containing protein n=1 Tax=Blastopirellula marina TaxID=124 RepID=A0A2S8FMC5_9BACT|nr:MULTISPECIES: carboxypeptidase-like regulatory domain-containing protein [Pirellulaceae]PQO33353.1 hypothetical protein C5Y96_10905 [Blastopirellula marina]RCS52442.1 carboxypeptidase regulatory-like domain-containing protein [Bremerella cremea]
MSNYARSMTFLWLLVPLSLAFTGCGGNDSGLYQVKGRLTHQGEPIAGMMIFFVPENTGEHPESYATTDDEGHFEMKVVSTPGVAPGKHTVYVQDPAAVQGGKTSTAKSYLAVLKKYGSEKKSTFTITVEEDMPDLELKLD